MKKTNDSNGNAQNDDKNRLFYFYFSHWSVSLFTNKWFSMQKYVGIYKINGHKKNKQITKNTNEELKWRKGRKNKPGFQVDSCLPVYSLESRCFTTSFPYGIFSLSFSHSKIALFFFLHLELEIHNLFLLASYPLVSGFVLHFAWDRGRKRTNQIK